MSWLARLTPPRGWGWLVPGVLLLAGLLFATSAMTAKGTNLRGGDSEDLSDVIRRHTIEVERQAREVDALRREVDAMVKKQAPRSERMSALQNMRSQLESPAGFTPVTGSVLSVSLDDAKLTAAQLPQGFSVDDIVVHQQDVQAVVNALWAGGATSMMIQDQRVISTSAVRCVGNTLLLQGRVYSPPFTIKAMGDVPRMKERLENDAAVGTYREYVRLVGLGYDVKEESNVTFPAYTGRVALKYARRPGASTSGRPSTTPWRTRSESSTSKTQQSQQETSRR